MVGRQEGGGAGEGKKGGEARGPKGSTGAVGVGWCSPGGGGGGREGGRV